MAFADDYALIGDLYGGNTTSLWNVERRYSNNGREGLDINVLDDTTETDVEFMTQLYRNSHPNYFLGSWIVKPIIEILLHYMGYPRVTSKDTKLANKLNEFYEARKSSLQQLFRELGLFGEEYAIIGYDSELGLPTLKPRNKTYIVETRYEDFNNPDDLTYVTIKEIVKRVKQNSNDKTKTEFENIVFLKTYWKEDNPQYKKAIKNNEETDEPKFLYFASIKKKVGNGDWTDYKVKQTNFWSVIPIIAFQQNRLSNDSTGYSDANGLIKLCGVYHQVFESMIDTNIYNGKPTLVFSGLSDAEKFIETTYGEISPASGEIVNAGNYELFGSYYLEGSSSVNYLQVGNNYIDGAKEILRLLFYIYVQISGVPEWALGAHIDGTYASTKMQSTPLVQKIESKRLDVNDAIVKMNMVIAKIIEANEEIEFKTYLTQLEWSEPLPEDRDYILQALDKIIPLEVLTDEKILEILDIVANPADEINKKKQQKQREQVNTNIDKNELLKGIKEKLGNVKGEEGEEDTTGEMDVFSVLKSVLGENFAEELGLDE